VLIDRYDRKDIAVKVVGVGSVGTFCTVTLLMASERDPLFLQVKEARPAHARSGAPARISGYLGTSDAFDKAIAAFSIAYADQTERDHAVFKKAVRSGRIEVQMEE